MESGPPERTLLSSRQQRPPSQRPSRVTSVAVSNHRVAIADARRAGVLRPARRRSLVRLAAARPSSPHARRALQDRLRLPPHGRGPAARLRRPRVGRRTRLLHPAQSAGRVRERRAARAPRRHGVAGVRARPRPDSGGGGVQRRVTVDGGARSRRAGPAGAWSPDAVSAVAASPASSSPAIRATLPP